MQILRTVTSILAPITPHLAEEIYYFRNGAVRDPKLGEDGPSVFQELWQGVVSSLCFRLCMVWY